MIHRAVLPPFLTWMFLLFLALAFLSQKAERLAVMEMEMNGMHYI